MKEEIDIIDAHDNIVAKKDRSVVHKEGLLHRIVVVMLFDPDGRVYMQQRALSNKLYPGYWEGSLSGHVKSGESMKDAAERELHEELGVCVPPKHLKKILRFGLHEENERVLATLYVIRDYKGKVKIDREELKSGEFWTLKKIADELKRGEKLFHPLFKKSLDIFKKLGEHTQDFVRV
jgi:isopentenyl-diphosphate delta-isomerase